MDVAEEIREFITTELLGGSGPSLELTDDLLALDVIDSLGITELVGFIEDRFGTQIDDVDLTPENFTSIASIAALVKSRSAG